MRANASFLYLYLISGRIDSDAMAHIKDAAEYKPPPHKSGIDDNKTNGSGNIRGKAPYGLSAYKRQASIDRQVTDRQGTLHSKRQLRPVDISPRASDNHNDWLIFQKVSRQEVLNFQSAWKGPLVGVQYLE